MKRQKVIIRFLDGRILKGYIKELSQEHSQVSIVDEKSNEQSIQLNQLKAVFYVKSFKGNRHYAEKKTFREMDRKGKKILVRFKDGESVTGHLEGDVPWERGFFLESKKGGFFLIPSDYKSNNRKIFVVSESVTNVTCF
jgi:hypothetical protein